MKKVIACIVVVVVVALVVRHCTRAERPTRSSDTAAGNGSSANTTEKAGRPAGALPAWFVRRDAPARRIAGRVTYRGAPMKDAVVVLQSALTFARVVAPVEVRTGADGRFDLGMQPAAQFDLTAASPGTTAAILHLDLADPTLKPPSDQLELRLGECAASVEGTIVDAIGNPLPKVHVRRNALVGVESDARGAYKLCVPWGDAELEYRADGFGAVVLTIDARGEMHRDVVLVPEATLTVRVVRADNGEPVPDASVMVNPGEWGADRAASAGGVTDRDGQVRIDELLPGRYQVWAVADGLLATAASEAVAQVGVPSEVVIKLEATARITGKVLVAGKPVAGARVVALRKSPANRSRPAVSLADGTFVIDRVPAGEVMFTAAPYAVDKPASLKVEAGKSHDVVIEVHAQATIHGRVTRNGTPVGNVDVCCVHSLQPPETKTDVDGTYAFRGVAAGTYHIGGGADEVGAFTLGTKVTVADGDDKVVDLELDMAGTIAGTVVDTTGKPVPGVFVRWIHDKTGDVGRSTTDAQGRYRCGAMTGGGAYRASVFPSSDEMARPYPTADGAPYPVVDVKDGSTVIENVKLAIDRPQLAISGHVVDDAGAEVPDAIVKALPTPQGRPALFQPWMRLPLTSTDADGAFTIRNLAPGTYALQARAADGAEGSIPPVEASSDGVTIRIERPGSIAGKLVGFKQPPNAYARRMDDRSFLPISIEGTAFRLGGLHPGRYLVSAQSTTDGDAQVVEVRAGQTTNVALTSQGKAAIEGTVLDFRTRAPIANAACNTTMSVDGEQAIASWELSIATKSDARGRVVFDPAPAGAVDVFCQMPMGRFSPPSATAVTAAGGRASIQLLSAELTIENPSTIGLVFDWRRTPPRIFLVEPGSPAAKAGLLAGDLVTQVNGTSVQGLNGAGVAHLIGNTPPGDDVRVTVLRGAATKTFTAKAIAD